MIITCDDCGEHRHIHKAYLPAEGESESIVCSGCGKEWELYRDRSGFHLQAVTPEAEGEF